MTFKEKIETTAIVSQIMSINNDVAKNATTEKKEELQEIEEDIDIETLFDELANVEVDGGFDGENDDNCPNGACKI